MFKKNALLRIEINSTSTYIDGEMGISSQS